MRRTVGWLVGVCVSVGLTGVAAADLPERRATPHPASASDAGQSRPEVGLVTGRERVGTVDRIARVLGFPQANRPLRLHYPGASYVKVHLERARLLPGDQLTVAGPGGEDIQRYAMGDIPRAGRWAMSVQGDTALVTLHTRRGPSVLPDGFGVVVDRVARGLTPTERTAEADRRRQATRPRGTGREESICGRDEKVDAICYKASEPAVYYRTKAVARLLINGSELCTAWRIGPRNRMITNNHCFSDTRTAQDTEVWFNYMCAECGGYEVFRSTKVWADQVLATDARLDYTLFTVSDFAAIQRFGYLELDLRRAKPGEEIYIPQHPAGDPTSIAIGGNCGVDDPGYDGYDTGTDISYFCDTEGGSSGSPVLSRATNRVLALHHFGGCPNSGVRLDLIHRQISTLL